MNQKYSLKENTSLVSLRCPVKTDVGQMADDEIPRSIRFSKKVWEAIDRDASRCRRSAVKQMEAIFLTYYEIENVEIDKDKLKQIREPQILNYKQTDSIPVLSKKVVAKDD
jgi:hypothetical protein